MHKRKGFTLIELIVVIAILGILAGIAIPSFTGNLHKVNLQAVLADVRAIERAALVFYMDTGQRPQGNFNGLETFAEWNADSMAFMMEGTWGVGGDDIDGWKGPYLVKWPEETPFGGAYAYRHYDITSNNATANSWRRVFADDGTLTSENNGARAVDLVGDVDSLEIVMMRFTEEGGRHNQEGYNAVVEAFEDSPHKNRLFRYQRGGTQFTLGYLINNR